MPMLNILRPHRRTASAQDSSQQQHQQQSQSQGHSRLLNHHTQSSTAIHFLPPARQSPSPTPAQTQVDPGSTAPATLPPLNFGSPGLGSSSPNGFLNNNGFGNSGSSASLAANSGPAVAAAATAGTGAGTGGIGHLSPNPALLTTTPSPKIGSPSLNKALPAPPSSSTPPPTLKPPQTLQPSTSPGASRPGSGNSAKNASGGAYSSAHQLPLLLTSFGHHGKSKEKDASHSTQPSSGHHKRNAKLNILNPMSRLMRRRAGTGGSGESSRKNGPRELPDDFDPGIIYATRHPDWSSPGPKRPPVFTEAEAIRNARAMSPALAGLGTRVDGDEHADRQRTPMFREVFGDEELTPVLPKLGSPERSLELTKSGLSQQKHASAEVKTPALPPTPVTAVLASPAVSMGTTLVEKTPPVGAPPPIATSPEVLMPTKSNASSASSSPGDEDDTYPQRRRKGVTLVDHPLSLPRHLMNNSSRFSFEASSAAGSSHGEYSPGLEEEEKSQTPIDPNIIGLAMTKDPTPSPTKSEGIGLGLGLGGVRRPHRKRVQPRWTDDDDIYDDVVDMAAYENDDDDLYYDDGMILRDIDNEEQGFENDDDNHGLRADDVSEQQLPPQPLNGDSNGEELAAETNSMVPSIGGTANKNGPAAFPPFMNPIGGGFGYQKQLEQFYSPDMTRINQHGLPLALQTLNQSLCRIQKQQLEEQQQSDELDSPAPGFGNEIDPGYNPEPEETMNFDDEDDMDDPMVAEANAEALAYDTEGEYGQEFGFYSANNVANLSNEQLFAGGYFGDPNMMNGPPRPFLVRRPSLTPISERSECSYRNSMVFGFDNRPGSRGGGHPLSNSLAGLTLDGEQGEDMSISQLLKLRWSWGGSQPGSVKSAPGSPGGITAEGRVQSCRQVLRLRGQGRWG
ncbi:hypothetical protein BDZ91DRAFT_119097 [Kalaharituber pfeilii]|nr:hypothetical protein BDZ91DRAFT_119097 [Kalaharituber pfeilii]